MFATTIINFLLSSSNAGNEVALLIAFTRKTLMTVPDNDYPTVEKIELINDALQNVNIIALWASIFPVSISSRRCRIPYLFKYARWRYFSVILLSFEGLGSSSQIDSG